VKRLDREQQEFVLNQLRVTPIWFEDFADIPDLLGKMLIG